MMIIVISVYTLRLPYPHEAHTMDGKDALSLLGSRAFVVKTHLPPSPATLMKCDIPAYHLRLLAGSTGNGMGMCGVTTSQYQQNTYLSRRSS